MIRFTLMRLNSKLFYCLFVKNVEGVENIPPNTGFVIAANHSSYLDILSLSAYFLYKKNINMLFLAKKELFNDKIFRIAERIYKNVIPIDRKKSKESLNHAIKALKNKGIITIYPEGTRSLDGRIQIGKTGVARLALWADVPVVPVGIKGAFELMPKGRIIPKFRKNIVLKIGKPMYFRKYSSKPMTKKLLRKITDEIMKEIAKLSGQKYNY